MEDKTPKRAWGMLLVVYLCSVAAPLAQFKTPPLASWLFSAFNLTPVQFGLQMSAIGIVGLVLAFPAAYICRSLGGKNTVIVSMVCLAIGSFGGALVSSFEGLMITRLLEGVGLGLVGVVGPTLVSCWFPEKTRGIALGLWATWVPLAMVVIYAVAPTMAQALGYKAVFIACGIFDVVALVLFMAFFRMPDGEAGDFSTAGSFKDTLALMKNGRIWLLGVVMMCYMFISTGALSTYYNTFLVSEHGYDDVTASMLVSLFTVIGIVSTVLGGALSDRVAPDKKRFIIIGGLVVYAITTAMGFPSAGPNAQIGIMTLVIVGAFSTGFVTGVLRPLSPLIMGGGAMGAGLAMAILQFMQNVGAAVGSPAFGAAYESVGWTQADWMVLMPVFFVAIVLSFFLKPKATSDETATQG